MLKSCVISAYKRRNYRLLVANSHGKKPKTPSVPHPQQHQPIPNRAKLLRYTVDELGSNISAYILRELPITSTIAHVCAPLNIVAQTLNTPALRYFVIAGESNGISSGTANSVSSNIVFTSELILHSSSVTGGTGLGSESASSHLLSRKAHSREQSECWMDQMKV